MPRKTDVADPYTPLASPAKPPSSRSDASTTAPSHLDGTERGLDNGSRPGRGDVSRSEGQKGGAEVVFSRRRRWFLLFLFSVSQYLDIASRSSTVAFVPMIMEDLDISYETSTWVMNSYGVPFASFLLLFGKVADLYSAKPVFTFGFLFCGLSSILISFMTDQYAFYVFRALYGIRAAATIPSAFRLILAVFPAGEVQMALGLFSLSAALANTTGLIIGGLFGLIDQTGQMAAWRWYFRAVAMISIPCALAAHLVAPWTGSTHPDVTRKWKYLDLPGCLLILSALMLLNVGLVTGASRGWTTADFFAPFLVSWPLAVVFFLYEARKDPDSALLPKTIWRVPNLTLMVFVSLPMFAALASSQLPLVERYQSVFGESIIKSAVRILPQGVSMCITIILISPVLKKVSNMRYLLTIGFLVGGAMFVPFIYGDGEIGTKYWKYYFPSFVIGAALEVIAFLAANITIMTSVPPSMAGVAGALFQSALQNGVVIAYSVQAGLMTVHPGSVANFDNVRIGFWALAGWGWLCGLLVLVLYKRPARSASSTKASQENQGEGDTVELSKRGKGSDASLTRERGDDSV
ncbi:major facilitator superfamily domain-containing protein [Papiliotrema laurentii]|uniref:Major facilitator superfamily domain-containing protein n=1 Tax=Papiliotrema laurentii TaxID=5418 RepID=A0AAD9FP64_PAPLA|nr:major facilitator superfamily domain-containing protein [Papiliotrema laurentii]